MIVASNADTGDELCRQALDILLTAYGAEAGNAALKWLPFGGLYIAGGLGAFCFCIVVLLSGVHR